jgi:hypothetical protein
MQTEQYQASRADFAQIWHSAQHRRTDDMVGYGSDILKAVALFCGPGLLLSLLFAVYHPDLSVGIF